MITLGIESTAHTLGIGVVENGKVLSNAMDTYKPIGEGIYPRKAADHHSEVFVNVLEESLSKARVGIDDIDLISFAQGPGIGAPLRVGIIGAKYLAAKYGKKVIGVNHAYAHVKISEHLTGLKNPLVLYVSGGNTQILIEEPHEKRENKPGIRLHVLGETLDIGIGNLFDTFGRTIGLEYAHGAVLAKLAEGGTYVELPYTVKGMNLVFSGLLTQAEKLVREGAKKEDIAHSLFETSFAMLCEATERALFLTKKKKLIVCGGVAQNRKLQEMLRLMCKEDGVKFGVAPDEFNRDNGAMIAYAGEVLFKKYGTHPIQYWKPIQNYRVEMIKEIMRID
ncbi:TPA: tRNA (adenosine(37)-N6)-threonylcarbamoyltransferase complex transferase subunit TsaD [Candidatus Micrarchaeota archaeon]|nr:tRNA (adenosine(37)-N6)-threonylcarbamoyltransferase complex transferase subunit TsaD [Candidatus Micrarchaeota archaeon]